MLRDQSPLNTSKKGSDMYKKWTSNFVAALVMSSLVGGVAPSSALAMINDEFIDSQSEVESAQANLEETENVYEDTLQELGNAKSDRARLTRENVETAARIRKEIQQLETKQKSNVKQTARLTKEIENLEKEINKNEAAGTKARSKAQVVQAKLDSVRAEHEQTVERSRRNAQEMRDAKAALARVQKDLKNAQNELARSKSSERKSAQELKKAQGELRKTESIATKEMQRLDRLTKAAIAKTDEYERKAEQAREKKARQEEKLRQKRERLSDAKEKQKKALARLSSMN